MPIKGRYFPSQKPEEKIFLLLRRHWFTYVAFLVIAAVMSIPLFALLVYWLINPQVFTPALINLAILGSSAYFLFIVALLFFGFIDYYLDVYIVTNERIVDIEQNGFFKRKISELHLHQVQDVNAQVKGLFATIMHYGDIYIQTAGERENFIFNSVPNPYRISKIIVDLHGAAIEAGVVKKGAKTGGAMKRKKESMVNLPKGKEESDFIFDLPTASLARERTKNFLGGGELVETNLSETKSSDASSRGREGEMHENEEIDI